MNERDAMFGRLAEIVASVRETGRSAYLGYDLIEIKPTDHCANCGRILKLLPHGAREACKVFHGGNTGFYLTTSGPPGEGFKDHSLKLKGRAETFYVFGSKKNRVVVSVGRNFAQLAAIDRLLRS